MNQEGAVKLDTRRYGLLAGLRNKQWWYFEGLDPERKLYFVFLALKAFPLSYVSLKLIDFQNNTRWTEDHLGDFQAAPGNEVAVFAKRSWGYLQFSGCAENGWSVEVETPHVKARCAQQPKASVHRNWLLTQHIDYTIQQFISNSCEGTVQLNGKDYAFSGYGYHEHNWGVQPRHSTARWLHFWSPTTAGVVLSCQYYAGIPHAYSFLWHDGSDVPLHAPAEFSFHPSQPSVPWTVTSPDLSLQIQPITDHHTRMQIPPILAYVDVDYYEQLLEVQGTALIKNEQVEIRGIGKFDFNWNRW
jgi:hypothetical protein